jgi:hypothetical protein
MRVGRERRTASYEGDGLGVVGGRHSDVFGSEFLILLESSDISSLAVKMLLDTSSHPAALSSFIRPLPLRPSSAMTSTYLAKLPVSRALLHFFLHLPFIVPTI